MRDSNKIISFQEPHQEVKTEKHVQELSLSHDDKKLLLALARQMVQEAVQGARDSTIPNEYLLFQNAGAFVSLYLGGVLRGSIGRIQGDLPLACCIAECAGASAIHDTRFTPVTQEEVSSLSIEINVLSPLFDIHPEEIEIGRHGLHISLGKNRGVLLPKVAVEWNLDRKQFLSETCIKVGLPMDAWQHGARIQAFTTVTFSESPPPVKNRVIHFTSLSDPAT